MNLFRYTLILAIIALFACRQKSNDNSSLKVPKQQLFVSDYGNVFTKDEVDSLKSLIVNNAIISKSVFHVLTLPENYVHQDSFNALSLKIAKTWKIGYKVKNNGILIMLSTSLRKIRIENGLGIEKLMTDSATKVIIDSFITPSFKEGNYYKGIENGIKAIMEFLKNNNTEKIYAIQKHGPYRPITKRAKLWQLG